MDVEAVHETAKTLLFKILEELTEDEFKKFKFLLAELPVRDGKLKIPGRLLRKADRLDVSECMVDHYEDQTALEMAADLLQRIPRMELFDTFKCSCQRYFARQPICEANLEDHKQKYKEFIKKRFRIMRDDSRQMGEHVTLKERYTRVLIVKNYRNEDEKMHEIISTGRKHLDLIAQQAEDSYSSLEALFDPEEDGHVPSTVVLLGAAGIGKTMTARKIMLDWASGELFQDRFEFVFYIHCREYNLRAGQETVADFLLQSCWQRSFISMRELEAKEKKLLFVIDGFDELKIPKNLLLEDPSKFSSKDKTVTSLIRKLYLPECYIIITTRPTAMETLRRFLTQSVEDERLAEIIGFSEDNRKEYFAKFFRDETVSAHAFNIVKENTILFTMCFVPIVCWIVCKAIKQQTKKKEDFVFASRTTTSIYLLFFSNLLHQQCSTTAQRIININLRRLCCLAKEGIHQQKMLFDEGDLKKHGLDVPAVQSLLLINDLFEEDDENCNIYSFIHLSFQEFFAALFYLLREHEAATEHAGNPNQDLTSLLESYSEHEHAHFTLTVRFLFGLVNKERLDQMERRLQWKVSPDIKAALLTWIKEELKRCSGDNLNYQMDVFHRTFKQLVKSGAKHLAEGALFDLLKREMTVLDFGRNKIGRAKLGSYHLDLLHCLYEIQDEDFVESATEHLTDVRLSVHSVLRSMNVMDFRALAFCLKSSLRVQGVGLKGIEMHPEHLTVLQPGLMKCSNLLLWGCSITSSCCADLTTVLKTNTSLTSLNLRNNDLKDAGVEELCNGLCQRGCQIKTLVLMGCSLTGLCCADLASVLRTNRFLTELDLSSNGLRDSGMRELCEGLKHPACKIQKLRLMECSLTGSCCADIASILRTDRPLTELDLSKNPLGDSGIRELCEGLKHPGCRLQALRMEHCSLTGSCCAELSSVLRVNSSLTELDLSKNELEDSGVTELCEALKHPVCTIQALKILKCSLTGACCADLSTVLRTNMTLRDLNLGGNELKDRGVRELCEGLKQPGCKIQTLGIASCSLTGLCCANLSSVLTTNTSLTNLDLSWNTLENSGLKELCEALRHPNCKIQILNLGCTSLTDGYRETLSSVIHTNHYLQRVHLFGNKFFLEI